MPERKVLLTEKKGREGELLPIQRIVAEEEAREERKQARSLCRHVRAASDTAVIRTLIGLVILLVELLVLKSFGII